MNCIPDLNKATKSIRIGSMELKAALIPPGIDSHRGNLASFISSLTKNGEEEIHPRILSTEWRTFNILISDHPIELVQHT